MIWNWGMTWQNIYVLSCYIAFNCTAHGGVSIPMVTTHSGKHVLIVLPIHSQLAKEQAPSASSTLISTAFHMPLLLVRKGQRRT